MKQPIKLYLFYYFRDILLLEAGFLCLLVAPKRNARYVFVADLTFSERRGTSHGTKINFIITYTVYSSNRNLETTGGGQKKVAMRLNVVS